MTKYPIEKRMKDLTRPSGVLGTYTCYYYVRVENPYYVEGNYSGKRLFDSWNLTVILINHITTVQTNQLEDTDKIIVENNNKNNR